MTSKLQNYGYPKFKQIVFCTMVLPLLESRCREEKSESLKFYKALIKVGILGILGV